MWPSSWGSTTADSNQWVENIWRKKEGISTEYVHISQSVFAEQCSVLTVYDAYLALGILSQPAMTFENFGGCLQVLCKHQAIL